MSLPSMKYEETEDLSFLLRTPDNTARHLLSSDLEVQAPGQRLPCYLGGHINHELSASGGLINATINQPVGELQVEANNPSVSRCKAGHSAASLLPSQEQDVEMKNISSSMTTPSLASLISEDSFIFPLQSTNWPSNSTLSIPGATTFTPIATGNISSSNTECLARGNATQGQHRRFSSERHMPIAAPSSYEYVRPIIRPNFTGHRPEWSSPLQFLPGHPSQTAISRVERRSRPQLALYDHASSLPHVRRAIVRAHPNVAVIRNPYTIPAWASWIDQDRNPATSKSYPSIGPETAADLHSRESYVKVEDDETHNRAGHGVMTPASQEPSPSRTIASGIQTPLLEDDAQGSGCSNAHPCQSVTMQTNEPEVTETLRSTSMVHGAKSGKKRKRAAGKPREPSVKEPAQSPFEDQPHSRRKRGKKRDVMVSSYDDDNREKEKGKAPTFISDRIGDEGRCKYTVKGDDGFFRKVCNSEIIDHPDAVRAHFTVHYREHGLYDLGEAAKVMCPWCKEIRTQFGALHRHIVEVHLKIHLKPCPCGGKNSRSQQKLHVTRHMRSEIHRLWIKRVERQLEDLIGAFQVDLGQSDDFVSSGNYPPQETVDGSRAGSGRRRRYSI